MHDYGTLIAPTVFGSGMGYMFLLEILHQAQCESCTPVLWVAGGTGLVLVSLYKWKSLWGAKCAPVVAVGLGGVAPFLVHSINLLFSNWT